MTSSSICKLKTDVTVSRTVAQKLGMRLALAATETRFERLKILDTTDQVIALWIHAIY